MSEETQQPAAKVDDMMLTSERREYIDRFALNLAFKSQCGDEMLTEEEDMIVDLSRHLAGLDQKMENLSQKFRIEQNTLDGMKESAAAFLQIIEKGLEVAKGGILCGDVTVLEAVKSDFLQHMVGGRK